MASLKTVLAVTAVGVLVATPGFAQTGGTGAPTTPAPGGSTPSGIGGTSGGATSTPRPQGGTAPSTTPGSSTIQR